MIMLGIESSCDETAVAIVNDDKQILSNQIYSQIKEHKDFGGVVPEIAARSHIECLPYLLKKSLNEASIQVSDLDAIAATGGPGLIGGVMVGVIFAKTLASITKKPFIAVNHLEGHALTVRLTNEVKFPYILLLASGGHCQFLLVEGVSQYQQISSTIDDAAGETFDKVAKMLGLGYPGGSLIEKLALHGNPKAFLLPKPLCEVGRLELSFSGLKTAVKQLIDKNKHAINKMIPDICASFQDTVANILLYKTNQVIKEMQKNHRNINNFVMAGGVAANKYLSTTIANFVQNYGYHFIVPPMNLCTDNAAMIAWAGLERFKLGLIDDLNFKPLSRWPLSTI